MVKNCLIVGVVAEYETDVLAVGSKQTLRAKKFEPEPENKSLSISVCILPLEAGQTGLRRQSRRRSLPQKVVSEFLGRLMIQTPKLPLGSCPRDYH